MPRLTVILAALLAALAFAIPAAASAQTFTVDSPGDQKDAVAGGECKTAENTCTLRAAIESSNAAGGLENLISFSPAFDGGSSSTISPATELPAITSTAVVAGGTCPHGSGFGPCVGIDGPGQTVLKVQASFSAVYSLSITSGFNGIEVSGTEDFVQGNWIGTKLDGSTATNSSSGISVTPGGILAVVGANQIRAASSGIQTQSTNGEIFENEISGAFNGILISGGNDNLIEANTVSTSGNSSLSITGNGNEVFGNEFNGSNFSTIFIKGSATENRIGADTAASENLFVDSEYSPIAIITQESTQNEVARNRGDSNGEGNFVLINKANSAEPNFANGGIRPPTFSTALQSSATGTAEPGAKVRVFRKATEFGSEIESFLGEAVADGSGNWKVSYGEKVPTATFVAASQTNAEGGTSEFEIATSTADPTEEKEEAKKPPEACLASTGACGGGGPVQPATPETTIAKKPKLNGGPTAKFKFTSTISGSSFECKLDKKKFAKCRSPKTYKKLKPGKHVFKVRAVSPAGVADPTPATKKFTVKPS